MKNNKPFILAGIFSIFFAISLIGMIIISKNREAENPKKVVFEVVFKKISTNSIEEGEDCEDNYSYSNKCRENKGAKNTAKIKVKSSDGSNFRLKNFKPKISYFNLNNEKTKEDNREYTSSSRISLPFTQNNKYFEVEKDYKFIETYIFDNEADKVEIEYSGKKFTFESDDFKKYQEETKEKRNQLQQQREKKLEAEEFGKSFSKDLEDAAQKLETIANDPNAPNFLKRSALGDLWGLYNKCDLASDDEKYLYSNVRCRKYKPIIEKYKYLYGSNYR